MWQITVLDPSGETRTISLKEALHGTLTIGSDPASDVLLRDPTAPKIAAVMWATPCRDGATAHTSPTLQSPYWLKAVEGAPEVEIGDLKVREANVPAGLPIHMGESRITLDLQMTMHAMPEQPSGIRHWLTCCEEGRKILWMTKKAAGTPLSIYLAGETGTGKEVLAHLVHAWSDRAAGPFVPLHCGALPLTLAESELFGHVKGAFTGAVSQRPGALLQAHGGTLFLDEIGDLPLDIQVKLLRFLENGEIRPVGADRPSRADVRIICATHHPLKKLVDEGKFRRDLYYRLASVTIDITPLRSRPEDIRMLATRFASELNRTISPKAMLRFQAHSWPGNVRELRHAIERASGLAGPFHPVLGEDSFEFLLTPDNVEQSPQLELGAAVLTLEEMERVMLLKALRLAHGNRGNAAKILGIARSTLFEMLKRHRIQGPKSPYLGAHDQVA